MSDKKHIQLETLASLTEKYLNKEYPPKKHRAEIKPRPETGDSRQTPSGPRRQMNRPRSSDPGT